MVWNFRSSITVWPGTRVSLSTRGVGVSVRGKGWRMSAGPSGVRHTVRLPGTGVSSTTKVSAKKRTNRGKR